jgi:hypothetical protein
LTTKELSAKMQFEIRLFKNALVWLIINFNLA